MTSRTTLAGPAAASLMIAWIVAASVASGQGHKMDKETPLIPPDPELAARYEKDAGAIKSLQDAVKDGSRSEDDRMKDFRQKGEPKWLPSNFISGPQTMPVTFTAAKRAS